MPYASASVARRDGPRTAYPPNVAGQRDVGENERGDMTRLRGSLPPVVSVACALSPDAARGAVLRDTTGFPDDADR